MSFYLLIMFFCYTYKNNKYPDSFLSKFPKKDTTELEDFPKIIYCFWTGTNKMSENRKAHFLAMEPTSKVEIKLITPDNLTNYIIPEFPLHPAFNYLSLVHKSDYLRCYFMHHYGGGYSDIKSAKHDWNNAFTSLTQSNKWAIGYREIKKKHVASVEGKVGKDIRTNYKRMIGNCAYIFRPHTPFTTEWYNELHRLMDLFAEDLKRFPGNTLGDNKGYPIPWTGILGNIFHPLCLKYSDKLVYTETLRPVTKDYR